MIRHFVYLKTVIYIYAVSLRVRDINDAINDLGRMIAIHKTVSSSSLTKLTILQEAVSIITSLERRLRG